MNLHPIRIRDLPRLVWRLTVACIGVVLHLVYAFGGILVFCVRAIFNRRTTNEE